MIPESKAESSSHNTAQQRHQTPSTGRPGVSGVTGIVTFARYKFDLVPSPFELPQGVELIKVLPNDTVIGYDPATRMVGLYKEGNRLVHIEIRSHVESHNGATEKMISLHVHQDVTNEQGNTTGGQGYITLLTPFVLKLIKDRFSNNDTIDLSPAPGAVTKGLIEKLLLMKSEMSVPWFLSAEKKRLIQDAKLLMKGADDAKRMRKSSNHLPPQEDVDGVAAANLWDDEFMTETHMRLSALQLFEEAISSGLNIAGTSEVFTSLIGTKYAFMHNPTDIDTIDKRAKVLNAWFTTNQDKHYLSARDLEALTDEQRQEYKKNRLKRNLTMNVSIPMNLLPALLKTMGV